MTAATPERPADPAPVTGNPAVDAATEAVAGLEDSPLAEHVDRLAAAHEILHDQLQDRPGSPPPDLSDEELAARLRPAPG